MSAGRPIEWTTEKKDKAIEIIFTEMTKGKSLRQILDKEKSLPNRSIFYEWMAKDPNLSTKYFKEKGNIIYKKFDRPNILSVRNNINNDERYSNCSLYILNLVGTDYYKIGVSQNVKRRVRDLQSATPFDLNILIDFEVVNAYHLETQIHEKLKYFYVKSEWFIVPEDIINDIIQNIKLYGLFR